MVQLVQGVKDDVVDCLVISSGVFGSGPSNRGMRCKDRELGKRIQKKFLEGFGNLDLEELDEMAADFRRKKVEE